MAKQTLKQRKAIRSAAARKPRPVTPGYPEGYGDGWQACLRSQAMDAGREMVWADLKCPEPRVTPLCRDCLYCVPDGSFRRRDQQYRFARCHSPRNGTPSPVDGSREGQDEYCSIRRNDYGPNTTCGPNGDWFEKSFVSAWADVSGIPDILRGAPPKPSLWQRIKGWFA